MANRDYHTLRRALRGHDADLADITMELPTIGVMGPRSRALLNALTDTPLDNTSFPFGWSREMTVAGIPVRALRVSYVGELGWELYVAREGGRRPVRRGDGGGKGTRHPSGRIPHDEHATAGSGLPALGPRHHRRGHPAGGWTQLRGGMGQGRRIPRAPSPSSPSGPQPRYRSGLVQFKLEDPEAIAYHDEPIHRDGVLVGRTTSGMYGHTFGACLAMGYVLRDEGVTRGVGRVGNMGHRAGRSPASPHRPVTPLLFRPNSHLNLRNS